MNTKDNKVVDIEKLSSDLNLTDEQIKLLSDALELLTAKYARLGMDDRSERGMYFYGISDGLNHVWKLVNGIDDDYNHPY